MTPNRRDVLTFAATAATAVTVGTTRPFAAERRAALEDDRGDELPAYSQWLTLDDGGLEFTSVDWASLETYVEGELETILDDDTDVPAEYDADPMIALPSDGMLSAYFFVGLDLVEYGLARLLEEDAFESTIEGLVQLNEAFVVTGTIEPAEIDDRLTAEPELEFIRRMERTDEIGEYDVYTPVEGESDAAIAVGGDALVIDTGGGRTDEATDENDPVTILQRTIGASEGNVERATDESEAFEWLVESAGRGDVVVGQYGDPSDTNADSTFEALEDAEGLVSSLTVEDEETSTGDFAAIVAEPNEDALEELLGASADEQSVDIDGDRVTATATWREVD
ncbi:hypothetical protein [Natronoglomus mannanivorans]|uniref:Uncharacterized protein n=1 Tax=Natronoglomus mannanivorans TaxID=2979990 RepID=A0AAP3E3J1_9EURY|nr:hypothetical protein [Halobacteria archaeon AArc-xg1-1]